MALLGARLAVIALIGFGAVAAALRRRNLTSQEGGGSPLELLPDLSAAGYLKLRRLLGSYDVAEGLSIADEEENGAGSSPGRSLLALMACLAN
jgi:hypothetical protein